jgi:hypothetical protein
MVGSLGRGYFDVVPSLSLSDGETFTIDDGIGTPVVLEFDDDGSVTGSNTPVPIIGNRSVVEVRDLMIAAINAAGLFLRASAVGETRVLVENTTAEPMQVVLSETVADAAFTAYTAPLFHMWSGELPASAADDSMWDYDGTDWVERIPVGPMPAPRRKHAMWLDRVRGKIMMWGGFTIFTTLPMNDLWEWDIFSGTWHEIIPNSSPSVRSPGPSTAYDTSQRRLLIVGAGKHAIGEIVTPGAEKLIDGESFVLNDGSNPAKLFEFDDDAAGAGILVDITGSPVPDADTMGSRIAAEINGAASLNIIATDEGDGVISLLNAVALGTTASNPIIETVADDGFQVSGMLSDDDTWTLDSQGAVWAEKFPALQPDKARSSAMAVDWCGEMIVTTGPGYLDGETFSIDDSRGPVVFEYHQTAAQPGNVWVDTSGGASVALMKTRLIAAINGSSAGVTAIDGGTARLVVCNDLHASLRFTQEVKDPVPVMRESSVLLLGGVKSTGNTDEHHQWVWSDAGVSPYFSYPGVLQGRVEPVSVVSEAATDGSWAFCLGVNQGNLPSFLLDIGDEITLTQQKLIQNQQLLRFDWRMRYSLSLPRYAKVLKAGSADHRDGNLMITGDNSLGIVAPTPIFAPEHANQLVTVSGSAIGVHNSPPNYRITGVPSGQSPIGHFDQTKDQGTVVAGRTAIIENVNITDQSDTALTLEVLGARWRAQLFIDTGSGPVLRAELVENLVQSDPNGWQRGSMAAHISKVSATATLTFKLILEPVLDMASFIYTQGGSAGELWRKNQWLDITGQVPSSLFSSHPTATQFSDLFPYNVWGTGRDDVWLISSPGTILHWDGTAWSIFWGESGVPGSGLPDTAEGQNLNGIWGDALTNVYVGVGTGEMIHWDGSVWTEDTSFPTSPWAGQGVNSIWGSDPSNVLVATLNGQITRGSFGSWATEATSAGANHLQCVWGLDASHIWAAGNNGVITFYNGSTWASQTSGVSSTISCIWGTDENNVWACTFAGEILFFDGTSWSTQFSNGSFGFNIIWGVSATEIYAVGWEGGVGGHIRLFDGASWTDVTPAGGIAASSELRGFWGVSSHRNP